ncbi:hypothetical protein MNV49_007075 [Pseudohyphozyma bogoriensis]|nr:hypothetical protein MNV49_007075 [Pseudohyphozyma bogoriensis]
MLLSLPVSLILLAATSFASPASLTDSGITIPLHRRAAPLADADGVVQLNNLVKITAQTGLKYQRGALTFHKNTGGKLPGWTAPTVATTPTTKEKRQAEGLTPQLGQALWTGPIKVGTPGSNFLIDFDTGSADLWIPSKAVGRTNFYNATASSTGVATNKTFSILYGDGSTSSGPVYKDTMTVAGLSATGQAFAAVTTESSSFQGDPEDGILGMGYQSISNLGASPFFQTLWTQKKVKSNMFSFKLASSSSELYLGGVDSAKYTGAITYTPVIQQAMVSGNVNLGSKVAATKQNFIIDTGTTLNGSTGYYTCPCTTLTSTKISLTLGGRQFVIPAANINLGRMSATSTQCLSAIASSNIGINAWIVGDAFLKSVYTVFNLGTNQVGFATLKARPSKLAAPSGELVRPGSPGAPRRPAGLTLAPTAAGRAEMPSPRLATARTGYFQQYYGDGDGPKGIAVASSSSSDASGSTSTAALIARVKAREDEKKHGRRKASISSLFGVSSKSSGSGKGRETEQQPAPTPPPPLDDDPPEPAINYQRRRSSGASSTATKSIPRKPVPSYDDPLESLVRSTLPPVEGSPSLVTAPVFTSPFASTSQLPPPTEPPITRSPSVNLSPSPPPDLFAGPTPTQLAYDPASGSYQPTNGTSSSAPFDDPLPETRRLTLEQKRARRLGVYDNTWESESGSEVEWEREPRSRQPTDSSMESEGSFASLTAGPTPEQLRARAPGMTRDNTLRPGGPKEDEGADATDDALGRIPSGPSIDDIIRAYKMEMGGVAVVPKRTSSLWMSAEHSHSDPTLTKTNGNNVNGSHSTASPVLHSSIPISPPSMPRPPASPPVVEVMPEPVTARLPDPVPPRPTPHIKSIEEIIREHAGDSFLAKPKTTPAQALAASARATGGTGVNYDSDSGRSRGSVDSVDDEIRSAMKAQEREVSTPARGANGGLGSSFATPDDKSDARSFRSFNTPRSTTNSPSVALPTDSPSLAIERELATLLKSPRLTRLITLRRPPNAGLTVSLADVGSATGHPVVVFLGLGCVRYLIALYDEIAETFGLRLICIDRWGLGRTSEVEDVRRGFLEWSTVFEEVVDELKLGEFSILAHSAGAPYALASSLRDPSRVKGSIHLLAPWVSTSADSLAGAYKYLKYVPSGVIKTAQAAEWKINAWRLGKPPVLVHEPVGYDHRAGIGSADLLLAEEEDDRASVFSGDSGYPGSWGRATGNGRSVQSKGSRTFLGGIFGSGGERKPNWSGQSNGSKSPSAASVSTMRPSTTSDSLNSKTFATSPSSLSPSSRASPNFGRRSSIASVSTGTRNNSLDATTTTSPSPSTPSTPTPLAPPQSTLSGTDLANGLLRASYAESLKGGTSDLMVILERTSKPWGFKYEDVEAPVKVWQGDKDERISLGSVVGLERSLRNCKVTVVEGADHSLMTNGGVMFDVLESIAAEWET